MMFDWFKRKPPEFRVWHDTVAGSYTVWVKDGPWYSRGWQGLVFSGEANGSHPNSCLSMAEAERVIAMYKQRQAAKKTKTEWEVVEL